MNNTNQTTFDNVRVKKMPRNIVPSGIIAMLMVVAVETMFFGGLISGFIVNKLNAVIWPPVGQPRLPIAMTAINTLVLFASAVTFQLALRSAKKEDKASRASLYLILTFAMGLAFLVIQGKEWVSMINHGLTINSSQLGGFFYTVIGAHGIHVIAGLLILIWLMVRFYRGKDQTKTQNSFSATRVYWFFVVGLWPVLYVLIYEPKWAEIMAIFG
ncbi:MAG: cytochrome c oxidase subunit 3 [Spirochaetota bacterium]|nr:cytochrome c oxidase subunit 3 [Spirochaetota bacterium]